MKPGFIPDKLQDVLQMGASKEGIVTGILPHTSTSVYLFCADIGSAEWILSEFEGKLLLGSVVDIEMLSAGVSDEIMIKKISSESAEKGYSPQGMTAEQGPHPSLKFSDILEAMAGLTTEQREVLKLTLGVPKIAMEPPKVEVFPGIPGHANAVDLLGKPAKTFYKPPSHSFMQTGVPSPNYTGNPGYVQQGAIPDDVFQQDVSGKYTSAAQQMRISTFSGASKDSSYEQFRFEVKGYINQGIPEGLILMSVRRALKGQAQEMVLHMGETATLKDVIQRFDMLYGDVNPPQVLLAEFYAATQRNGEGVTEWYTRVEDLASRIHRKHPTIISSDNFHLMVNTQFWTKLQNANIKNALRHKVDTLIGSPKFIVEARKAEMEFKLNVKSNQINTDVTDTLKKSLDEILTRLTALEKTSTGTSQPNIMPGGNKAGKSTKRQFNGRCFKCNKWGHTRKNCPLNQQESGKERAPLTAVNQSAQ